MEKLHEPPALRGTLPCGVRTFLPPNARAMSRRPFDLPDGILARISHPVATETIKDRAFCKIRQVAGPVTGKGCAPRKRGRPARNLVPGWRSRSVSGRLQAGSGPFGVTRTGKARGGPRRSNGSNQVAERAEAVPDMVRAGRPQPCSRLEVAERQREVAGRQQTRWRELQRQGQGDPRRSNGSNQVAERAEAVPDMVRAGRPRSRVGILHTINREHGLHPALESGRAPLSTLEYHSPLEGESARQGRMPAVEPVGGQRGVPKGQPAVEPEGGQRGVAQVRSPPSIQRRVYSPSQFLSPGGKRGTAASWQTPALPPPPHQPSPVGWLVRTRDGAQDLALGSPCADPPPQKPSPFGSGFCDSPSRGE